MLQFTKTFPALCRQASASISNRIVLPRPQTSLRCPSVRPEHLLPRHPVLTTHHGGKRRDTEHRPHSDFIKKTTPTLAVTRVRTLGREQPGSALKSDASTISGLGPLLSASSQSCVQGHGLLLTKVPHALHTGDTHFRAGTGAGGGALAQETSSCFYWFLPYGVKQGSLFRVELVDGAPYYFLVCRAVGGNRPVGLLRKTSSSQRIGKGTTDLCEIMNDGTGTGSAGEGERMGMKV